MVMPTPQLGVDAVDSSGKYTTLFSSILNIPSSSLIVVTRCARRHLVANFSRCRLTKRYSYNIKHRAETTKTSSELELNLLYITLKIMASRIPHNAGIFQDGPYLGYKQFLMNSTFFAE